MKNIAKLGKPSLIFGFGQEKRLNLIKKYIDLKGKNIFGNIPLVNWLPLKIRNIFCPHVRVYTPRTLKQLFALTEFEAIDFVWPAFDKVTRKFPKIGKFLKKFANFAEKNFFLKKFGISVFMIAKKGV